MCFWNTDSKACNLFHSEIPIGGGIPRALEVTENPIIQGAPTLAELWNNYREKSNKRLEQGGFCEP